MSWFLWEMNFRKLFVEDLKHQEGPKKVAGNSKIFRVSLRVC